MKKVYKYLTVIGASALLTGCTMANFKYSKEEVKRNINRFCETGLEVDLNISGMEGVDTGTYHFGQKGNIFWLINNDIASEEDTFEGVAFRLEDEYFNEYHYDAETNTYLFEAKHEEVEGFETAKQVVYECLTYANTLSGLLKEAGTDEVGGRACTKYEFAYNGFLNMFSANADIYIYVDDETGITLKATHKLEADVLEEDGEFNFEILEFKTEGVIAPTLIDPVEEEVEPEGEVIEEE